ASGRTWAVRRRRGSLSAPVRQSRLRRLRGPWPVSRAECLLQAIRAMALHRGLEHPGCRASRGLLGSPGSREFRTASGQAADRLSILIRGGSVAPIEFRAPGRSPRRVSTAHGGRAMLGRMSQTATEAANLPAAGTRKKVRALLIGDRIDTSGL